ncbi:DUF732 domain-containing protein [Nocardia tengchongensis]|uniref:DUF732 domain-containing protein n=1 Tax=Nocardia tengchongensis TaxID=2055889 RepID=UPI003682A4E1
MTQHRPAGSGLDPEFLATPPGEPHQTTPEPAPEKKKEGNAFVGFLVIGALIAVPIFMFTSCGSNDNASGPASTSSAVAPASTVVAPAAEQPGVPSPTPSTAWTHEQITDLAYIATLDKYHVPYSSKEAAIRVAHNVCTARAAGDSETAVGLTIVKSGYFSFDEAGAIVGAAEAGYCPEYK